MNMDQDILLQMTDITKTFPGVKALDHVSLTLKRGTVHALMGENGAGKSTLMKCLFGIYNKDSGTILLEGKEVNFKNSREALDNGVAMVHQELNQALKRSVMDNIWLGRYPKHLGLVVDETKMYRETMKIFDELGINVDPHRIMSTMPVSQRQMVEIAKAVSYRSKVIVFDEPTSSLTEDEVEHLFRINNRFCPFFSFLLSLPLNASHFLSLRCSNFNFLLPRFSNLQNSRCSFGAQKAPAVSCRGCFCVTPRCTRSTRAPCPARRPCPRATPWRDRGRGPSRCSRGP